MCSRIMAILRTVFFLLCFIMLSVHTESVKRPNIIFYLADDLGWSDVSFHGSKQVPTPNIDALARDGIILNHYYVQFVCSPSRAALMTGRYPMRLGFQHDVIANLSPWGLPLNETTLPEYLKTFNYATHGVGKWHLGFFKDEYLPHNRGFDSFYGYWNGLEDYFNHFSRQFNITGLDLHSNCQNLWGHNGTYGPDLYTDRAKKIIRQHSKSNENEPLFLYFAQQAVHSGNFDTYPLECPEKYKRNLIGINHPGRHTFGGMISSLDHSVGEVFKELYKRDMLDDTIFIFSTDNGGAVAGYEGTYGSNFPFRGNKFTLWEGGVRGVSFIWSSRLRRHSRIHDGLMHITDWLPTILSAAGNTDGLKLLEGKTIDGFDQWPSIKENLPSPRQEILLNLDNVQNAAGIRQENFKLVTGTYYHGEYDGYYNQGGMSMEDHPATFTPEQELLYSMNYQRYLERSKAVKILKEKYGRPPFLTASCQTPNCKEQLEIECLPRPHNSTCNVTEAPCLFDIIADPCELFNLADEMPEMVQKLNNSINKYLPDVVPPGEKPYDYRADPALYGGVWVPWESPCCTVKGVCKSDEIKQT